MKGYTLISYGDIENCEHESTQPLDQENSECQCGEIVCDECGAAFIPVEREGER